MGNTFSYRKSLQTASMLMIMVLAPVGCAIKKGTINSYIDPTYKSGNIKTIAFFPIRNARFAPSEARQLNRQLSQEMAKKNPDIKIVPPSKSLRLINNSGLAHDWSDFVEDFYTSGIPDRVVLRKISKALNVDAVFQGQLENVFQTDMVPFRTDAMTRITVSFSIIETHTAKVIWESTADGIRSVKGFETAPPIKDAIDLAIQKVKTNMPLL